ncbi:MAG: hydrogenase maturation nickel metallochaperone HypA [Spirochaetales bacterium]|nr:hydrogenase maturation nickel metallochaperone HypA [Spirochaetales bacterium]
MHELSITESILSTVLKSAEKNEVSKIVKIHLEIGELNDMKPEWMQHYFDYLSKDTLAEGAVIEIHRKPSQFTCHSCGATFPLDLSSVKKVSCPDCGESDCSLTGGSEFYIRDMEAV